MPPRVNKLQYNSLSREKEELTCWKIWKCIFSTLRGATFVVHMLFLPKDILIPGRFRFKINDGSWMIKSCKNCKTVFFVFFPPLDYKTACWKFMLFSKINGRRNFIAIRSKPSYYCRPAFYNFPPVFCWFLFGDELKASIGRAPHHQPNLSLWTKEKLQSIKNIGWPSSKVKSSSNEGFHGSNFDTHDVYVNFWLPLYIEKL